MYHRIRWSADSKAVGWKCRITLWAVHQRKKSTGIGSTDIVPIIHIGCFNGGRKKFFKFSTTELQSYSIPQSSISELWNLTVIKENTFLFNELQPLYIQRRTLKECSTEMSLLLWPSLNTLHIYLGSECVLAFFWMWWNILYWFWNR